MITLHFGIFKKFLDYKEKFFHYFRVVLLASSQITTEEITGSQLLDYNCIEYFNKFFFLFGTTVMWFR